MLIVVKLNTPLGGRSNVTSCVGLNAASAPVLPLLNVCGTPICANDKQSPTITMKRHAVVCVLLITSLFRECRSLFHQSKLWRCLQVDADSRGQERRHRRRRRLA